MSVAFQEMRLGDAIELQRGFDLPSQDRRPGAVPIVSSSGMTGTHEEARVRGPGVVTGRYGTIGEVFFVEEDFWPLNTTLFVKDFKGNHRRYVSYLLRTLDYRALSDKSSVPGVNRNHLHELQVRVPPPVLQAEIADILGAIDDKIDLNRRMNQTLEAMAQALFRCWFVDFDPVRAKAEGRQPEGMDAETAALFPSEFDEVLLPRGWPLRPLLEVAELLSGGTPKTSVPEYWDGPIKWASAKDVSQCGSFFLLKTERTITQRGLEESSTKIIPGDCIVVVARGATCGRFTVLSEPMAMNQTCYALRPRSPEARWYLRFATERQLTALVQQAHGSVFDTITTSTFSTAKVSWPTPAVLRAFEVSVSPLLERIRLNLQQVESLTQLRDLLLPKLLSGEIRVREAEAQLAATA